MNKKYKLKQEKGVLHIGGGVFFYPDQLYDELPEAVIHSHGKYFEMVAEEPGRDDEDERDLIINELKRERALLEARNTELETQLKTTIEAVAKDTNHPPSDGEPISDMQTEEISGEQKFILGEEIFLDNENPLAFGDESELTDPKNRKAKK